MIFIIYALLRLLVAAAAIAIIGCQLYGSYENGNRRALPAFSMLAIGPEDADRQPVGRVGMHHDLGLVASDEVGNHVRFCTALCNTIGC
jgi:hypothetical protein